MDRQIREIQRRIIIGDASAEELDPVLIRSGFELVGYTCDHGAQPGEAVYLVPNGNIYSIVIRDPGGRLVFFIEEADLVGEHIGEYSPTTARSMAKAYIENTQPQWVPGTCANPECAAVDRIILISIGNGSAPWEAETYPISLRCVECNYEWNDYTG